MNLRTSGRGLIPAIVLTLLACAPVVQAQEMRIGFVNTERIFRESAPAKLAQQKLEAEFGRRDKELQDTAARIKTASEKLEKESAAMSEAEKAKRQRELTDQDLDFQRRKRDFDVDVNRRKNEELAAVLDRANKVIRQIAETEKYDLIFQEAVYASPRSDITDKVIRALNGTGK